MRRGTASRNWVRRSSQLRLLAVATMAIGMVVALGRPGPAGAGTTRDEGLRSLCSQVAKDPPTGGVEQSTDPPTGAPLQAGQTVAVSLRWDQGDFAASDLERVAHCVVTLDGKVRLDLSGSEAPSANDGEYRGSFVVPSELAPGDCLCVLGIVAGEAADGGPRRLGGNSCVTVTKPAPPATPPTTSVTNPPERPAATVLPAKETAPPALVPATETQPLPLGELPRTGPVHSRLLLALGGLALVLGGGAITTRR
jgi:LPXTG-motif cell wall-anchored protein